MKTRTAKMAPATTIELQSSTVSFCISMRRGPAQEVQKFADQIASEVAKSYSKTPESILRQLMTQFELSALSKALDAWPSAHRAADGCERASQLPRRWVACAIHAAWIAIHTTASRPGRRPTLRSMCVGPRMDHSIVLGADPSCAGGVAPRVTYGEYAPSSRLAIGGGQAPIIDRVIQSRALGGCVGCPGAAQVSRAGARPGIPAWCMASSGACGAAAKGAQAAQNRAMFCFTNAGLY
jgi:hypothetical protein